MSLPMRIIEALNNYKEVIGVVSPFKDEHIAWVRINHLYEKKGSAKFGSDIRPNAKYTLRWAEMSNKIYELYKMGQDVSAAQDSTLYEIQ